MKFPPRFSDHTDREPVASGSVVISVLDAWGFIGLLVGMEQAVLDYEPHPKIGAALAVSGIVAFIVRAKWKSSAEKAPAR